MNEMQIRFPCASCKNGNMIYSKVVGGMICTNEYCRMNKSTWRITHKEPTTSVTDGISKEKA